MSFFSVIEVTAQLYWHNKIHINITFHTLFWNNANKHVIVLCLYFFQSENLAVAYIFIKWVQLVLFLIKNLAGLQQQDQDNLTDSDTQRRSWANHGPRWLTLLNGNYLENWMLPQDPAVLNWMAWQTWILDSTEAQVTDRALQETQRILGYRKIFLPLLKNCTIFDVLISEDVINFHFALNASLLPSHS